MTGQFRSFALAALLSLGIVGLGRPAAAADTPKQRDIRKLLALTGSEKLGAQAVEQMLQQFKSMAGPGVSEQTWKEVRKDINVKDLIDSLVPIYDKHLSHADVKAIIAFYESPVGKKYTAAMPAITQESMVSIQQWSQKVGTKIDARLKKAAPQKGEKKDKKK